MSVAGKSRGKEFPSSQVVGQGQGEELQAGSQREGGGSRVVTCQRCPSVPRGCAGLRHKCLVGPASAVAHTDRGPYSGHSIPRGVHRGALFHLARCCHVWYPKRLGVSRSGVTGRASVSHAGAGLSHCWGGVSISFLTPPHSDTGSDFSLPLGRDQKPQGISQRCVQQEVPVHLHRAAAERFSCPLSPQARLSPLVTTSLRAPALLLLHPTPGAGCPRPLQQAPGCHG